MSACRIRVCLVVAFITSPPTLCACSGLPPVIAADERALSSAAPLRLEATRTQCELLGLGALDTVPYNFPGADAASTQRYRERFPAISETSLAPGLHSSVPAVFGGDMGAPFMHGDGKLYFTFCDAWFEHDASSLGPAGEVLNDDILASADPRRFALDACLGLDIPTAAASGRVVPITHAGTVSAGGHALGPGIVPGPGFSTGPYMFMLTSGEPTPSCADTAGDCAAANGIASDVCRLDENGDARCYFGECGADPRSPCALRMEPSTLVVRGAGSDFVTPQVGTQVESERVLAAYRGHFAIASFHALVDFVTGDGAIWVLGRDGFWGTEGLTMSPYLMFHPVHRGRLEAPRYFSGMDGDQPVFSADSRAAVPMYDETVLVNHHSSLVYEAELDGGTWLLLYGGHEQPALQGLIEHYVRPALEASGDERSSGVYLRTAKRPWGPWSAPQVIFDPFRAGQGGYCEQMYFERADGGDFTCPESATAHNAALNRWRGEGAGGEYGAAIVPGASTLDGERFHLRWLLSTWNPYRVIMLESSLQVGQAGPSELNALH